MAAYTELIEQIDTAIQDVLLNGQHVAVDGRNYTKADLGTLSRMRTEYARLAKSEKTSVLHRTVTGVPSR